MAKRSRPARRKSINLNRTRVRTSERERGRTVSVTMHCYNNEVYRSDALESVAKCRLSMDKRSASLVSKIIARPAYAFYLANRYVLRFFDRGREKLSSLVCVYRYTRAECF